MTLMGAWICSRLGLLFGYILDYNDELKEPAKKQIMFPHSDSVMV